MEFSQDIKDLLKNEWPNIDINNLSLEELKSFKEEVQDKRNEYSLLELAQKTLANASYGACANPHFYFFNVSLAGDITGECRNLTQTMNKNLENLFHETLWERTDLQEKFDYKMDESKHDWYRGRHVWIYSDTDSSYTTYGDFFKCMLPEYQEKYKNPDDKIKWILKFNKEFLDAQNNKWCEEIYGPRFGNSIHEFELETISFSGIYLKKKKYLKGLAFSKGVFYDKPKVSGTGIEIIKSTTPKLCRIILKDLMQSLMFDYNEEDKDNYIMQFNEKLRDYRKQFYNAPIEDISQSVGIGNYKKFVINDQDCLELGGGCPVSVHGIARFNYLAHKNNQDNLKVYSGKIKYYRIRENAKADVKYFGFPAGELPEWAPKMDKLSQWEKTVIEPINRFLEVMNIPVANAGGAIQFSLF